MILDLFRVPGQVAIVTGAGRGIGAATAIALAEAGADVVISARSENQLHVVAEKIRALGSRVLVVPADLSEPGEAESLAHTAAGALGRVDIVVNNVGGAPPRDFLNTKRRHMENAFQFNVSIAHELTRAAVPYMIEGAVVNISSALARVTGRGYLAYGTAKAALSHYTRLAARDLAPRIRVNAIEVGAVATPALDAVLTDEARRARVKQNTPLRRIGDPADVAAAVLYLASPAGSYLTGKVLEVDGGIDTPNIDPDL